MWMVILLSSRKSRENKSCALFWGFTGVPLNDEKKWYREIKIEMQLVLRVW